MLKYVCAIAIVLLLSTNCKADDDYTVKITVPRYVNVGDNVTLYCEYRPDNIYSVKWYMGQYEIFRFTPNEDPPVNVFPLNGVSIDINNSLSNKLVLKNLESRATGRYVCEVSWEAPSFKTAMRGQLMHIVEKPEGEVDLTIDNEKATCTTPPIRPRPNIIWFLNGVQNSGGTPPRTKQNDRDLKNFSSLFTLKGGKETYDNANLTCVVQIGDVYKAQKSITL
ncbi:unnamed protein product [Diabrotica balteata]|uniref:Ig-like domain-containing protein n=1 Tax=Diabrotica balteata TaxID=107213 RepID=A0A9N9T514_DIABA|nr:unnamed protein product [Diabrotica balteata]